MNKPLFESWEVGLQEDIYPKISGIFLEFQFLEQSKLTKHSNGFLSHCIFKHVLKTFENWDDIG